MKKMMIVAGLVLALGACKSKMDKALSEGEGIRDRMCACADKACADKVSADYKAWKSGNKDLKDEKPSKEQGAKGEEIVAAYRVCAHKLDGAAAPTPTTPPAATPPAATPPATTP
jgi:hypothetical protein